MADKTTSRRATMALLRAWAADDDDEVERVVEDVVEPVADAVTRDLLGIAVLQIRTSAKHSGLGVEAILQALWKPDPAAADETVLPAIRALITALALGDDELVATARPMVDTVDPGEVLGHLADFVIAYYEVLHERDGTTVGESLDDLERGMGLR